MNNTIPIKPDGFVRLVTHMGSDEFIAECARIGRKSEKPWQGLLRYMMAHQHTSPFEFAVMVFHVRLPIFVARQWMRHRMGTFNEWSARYMELPDKHWAPDRWRGQAKTNRQGSEGEVQHEALLWAGLFDKQHQPATAEEVARAEYANRIAHGVAREQARSCLPVSMYTEFYWKVDLHNLMKFLLLRSDKHAQQEIRDYAEAIIDIFQQVFPVTHALWLTYSKYTVTLTEQELAILRGETVTFNTQAEMDEAREKLTAARLIVNVPMDNPPWKVIDPPAKPKEPKPFQHDPSGDCCGGKCLPTVQDETQIILRTEQGSSVTVKIERHPDGRPGVMVYSPRRTLICSYYLDENFTGALQLAVSTDKSFSVLLSPISVSITSARAAELRGWLLKRVP